MLTEPMSLTEALCLQKHSARAAENAEETWLLRGAERLSVEDWRYGCATVRSQN